MALVYSMYDRVHLAPQKSAPGTVTGHKILTVEPNAVLMTAAEKAAVNALYSTDKHHGIYYCANGALAVTDTVGPSLP